MNYLSINCSVEGGFARLIVVILEGNVVLRHIFKSPSVFSFKGNSAEILNWHRENIISLITQFQIGGLVVKKTERTSFFSKPKNRDIFKMYLEGVMLSMAASIGKPNRHLYKREIQSILGDPDIFDLDIKEICRKYQLECGFLNVPAPEVDHTKEALLAAIAFNKFMNP